MVFLLISFSIKTDCPPPISVEVAQAVHVSVDHRLLVSYFYCFLTWQNGSLVVLLIIIKDEPRGLMI
jgi:hypothetical protein